MQRLPAQVEAQGKKADDLLKRGSDAENPPVVEPNNTPENPDNPPPPADTVESLQKQLEELNHKHVVLQGKYNNEIQVMKDDVNLLISQKGQIRQLTAQLREANGKLEEANLLIKDLQTKITEKPPEQPIDDAKPVLSLLEDSDKEYLRGEGFDDKTIEIFGNVMKKLASRGNPQHQGADKQEIEDIKKSLHRKEVNNFWKELEEKVPDWKPVNSSDAFNDWLDVKIPYSDKTRRDALQDAQNALAYVKVIEIFRDFKAENPSADDPGKKKPLNPENHLDPDSSVASDIQPDGGKPPQGKIYTREEVRNFYADVTRGKYKGKEEEQAKIDADILKAGAEGRIKD